MQTKGGERGDPCWEKRRKKGSGEAGRLGKGKGERRNFVSIRLKRETLDHLQAVSTKQQR